MGLIYSPAPTPAGVLYAPGSRLGEVQVQLPGGLVLGQVDEFGVRWDIYSPMKGWHNKPAPEGEQRDRVGEHGIYIGARWFPGRVVEMQGAIVAPSHAEAHRAQERLAAAIPHRLGLMTVYDGAEALQAQVMQEGEILWEDKTDRRYTFSCSVIATDPRRYSTSLLRTSTGLPTTSGGLVIDGATVPNPVPDPSFESGTGDWSALSGADAPDTDTSWAHSGAQSMLVARGAGSSTFWDFSDLGPWCEPNTTYTVSAWLLVPSSNTDDATLRVAGADVIAAAETSTPVRDTPVRVSVTFTTGAAADAVFFYVVGGADGQINVDDVRLDEGTEALPFDGQSGGLVITDPGLVIEGVHTEGVASIVNDGNFTDGSPLTMVVRGPCPPFTLRHRQTGRRIRYGLPLTAGRFLLLDSDRKVALEGSVGSDSYAVRPVRAMWFDALPGLNEVEFTATAYDPSARLELSTRHAWS